MTANALRPVDAHPIDITPDLFSDARIALIKQQVANGAPDHLFRAMIEIARVRGLDPLAKQISLINFGGTWQITTTIDGYRALAEQTGTYAGSDAATFAHVGEADVPHTATVTVWKIVQGQRVPFTATVYYREYQGKAPIWRDKPYTMLAKVAESHALRKAFPSTLSGMYTDTEMAQAGPVQEAKYEVVDRDTGEITASPPQATDDPEKRKVALSSVFVIGGDRGLAQDDIKKIAYHRYSVASMTALTVASLRDYWKFLNAEDAEGLQHALYEATQTTTDAEYREVGND